MKQTRKASAVVALSFLALFVCAAFFPAAAEEERIVLHYFTWAGGATAQYIREDWIEPFLKEHPNIEIVYEYASFSQFFDKLVTYYLSGNAPDLMHMSVGYVNELAQMGVLLNLQPFFDRDLNPDDFFLEPMKAVRYPSTETGDLYAMPFAFVLSGLFYNKTLFDSAGLAYPGDDFTYDDLRDYGKRLTRDTNGDGVMDQWGFFSTRNYQLLDVVIRAFGGRILDEDYNVVVTQPAAVAAAQFLVDAIHRDGIAPHPSLGLNQTTLFQQSRLAMSVGQISDISSYRDISNLDWDVAMMPIGPAGRAVRLWPDSFAISSTSKNAEAAWEFIKFAITRTEMDRYNGERKVPIYKYLATTPEWLEQDKAPNKMKFILSIPYGDPMEFRPNWGEWGDNGVRGALNPAWYGESTVEEALANWARVIEAAVAPYRNR